MPSFAWSPEAIEQFERELERRPHFARLNHVSIAVDDVEIAKRFYAEILGGRIINEGTPNFSEVAIAGTVIGMSCVKGQAQAADTEFPHIAFEIESQHFLPMKAWLEQHGVPTHAPWTRHKLEGLMYFKDPSGNLIEMYCPAFDGAADLQVAGTVDDVVDLQSLDYSWNPETQRGAHV